MQFSEVLTGNENLPRPFTLDITGVYGTTRALHALMGLYLTTSYFPSLSVLQECMGSTDFDRQRPPRWAFPTIIWAAQPFQHFNIIATHNIEYCSSFGWQECIILRLFPTGFLLLPACRSAITIAS